MNLVFQWLVIGLFGVLSGHTINELWTGRQRLLKDNLSDEDRVFIWRIVVFLLFPLFTLIDFRTTIVCCELFGGFVPNCFYGLFWYHVQPAGLTSEKLYMIVLFAGLAAQLVLAFSLILALFFRPHPALATTLGYTAVFILGLNLVVDPLLAICLGLGGSRWHLVLSSGSAHQVLELSASFCILALAYFAVVFHPLTRIWFAGLTKPLVVKNLRCIRTQWKREPGNPSLICRLGILFEQVGLRKDANKQLQRLKLLYPQSVYAIFLQAMLCYSRHNYEKARQAFSIASDFFNIKYELKASLLAASACSAFAKGDPEGALNLSERALEFDDANAMARMVKVDVFLSQGARDVAAREILVALKKGVDLNIENKVPLDINLALENILKSEEKTSTVSIGNLELLKKPV